MKEVNIKVNADTKQAEQNLNQLGNAADQTSQEMLGVADTAFAVAETITGSFAIATGAIGLFAGENEKMQKIATKANSVIAIALGVRQLAEQKANIAILANTVATKLNAAANKTTAATMKALGIATRTTTASFKAMKVALVSTGVGALIVGLGFAIEKLMSFGKQQEENTGLTDAQTEAIRQNSIFIEKNSKQTLGLAMAQDELGERGVILQTHLEDQERLLAKTNGMLAEAIVLHGADSIEVQRLTASQKMYQDGIISTTIAIEDNNKAIEERAEAERKAEEERIAAEEKRLTDIEKEKQAKLDALAEEEEAKKKAAEEERLRQEQAKQDILDLRDARMTLADNTAQIFGNMSALMEEGSKQQKATALTELAINTGLGFMNALRIAQQSAAGTGPGAALAFPIFYASQIAAVLGAVAQARQIIQSGGDGGGAGASGGAITYTAPYVPESAEQGTPNVTGDGGGSPVRAFVVSTQMTNAQALDEELQLQSTL